MTMLTNVTRRSFLAGLTLGAQALRSGRLFADTSQTVVTRTPSGALRGLDFGDIVAYRGVPFASPPVGTMRFKPAEKLSFWPGEYDATHFSAAPTQWDTGNIPQSEDCLYLNIWAPKEKGVYPVFVWIHGGGFTGGFSFDPEMDGAKFAAQGIVVVTVAYRLGVFGFLDFEKLLGPDYAGSANNGISDIIASLSWIQSNISSFGGDPDQVTIGGQSAGAKLTDILMGVPSAQPLFHQMISESGGAERMSTKDGATDVAKAFLGYWQTRTGSDAAALITGSAREIIHAQQDLMDHYPQHFPLRCEVDGTLFPRLPINTIAEGNSRGKNLLIGTNKDESAVFFGTHTDRDVESSDLGNVPIEVFKRVFAGYPALYPHYSLRQLKIHALTAEEYWIPSISVADAHSKNGGNTYMYRLDFTETGGDLAEYAYHGEELAMVWGKPRTGIRNAPDEVILSKQVHSAWVNFIHGNAPAADGLPKWPKYTEKHRDTLIIDTPSHVERTPQETERRLWDNVRFGPSLPETHH